MGHVVDQKAPGCELKHRRRNVQHLELAALAIDRGAHRERSPESVETAGIRITTPFSVRLQPASGSRSSNAPLADAKHGRGGFRPRVQRRLDRQHVEVAGSRAHDAEHHLERAVDRELERLGVDRDRRRVLRESGSTQNRQLGARLAADRARTHTASRRNAWSPRSENLWCAMSARGQPPRIAQCIPSGLYFRIGSGGMVVLHHDALHRALWGAADTAGRSARLDAAAYAQLVGLRASAAASALWRSGFGL